MSWSLEVWATEPIEVGRFLAGLGRWIRDDSDYAAERVTSWVRDDREWQITAESRVPVDPDEVPDVVRARLPGAAHCVDMLLEPLGAPDDAYELLYRAARAVASGNDGTCFDPQENALVGV